MKEDIDIFVPSLNVLPNLTSWNKITWEIWPRGWQRLTRLNRCDMLAGICDCQKVHIYQSRCITHKRPMKYCANCQVGIRDGKDFMIPVFFELGYDDTWIDEKKN